MKSMMRSLGILVLSSTHLVFVALGTSDLPTVSSMDRFGSPAAVRRDL